MAQQKQEEVSKQVLRQFCAPWNKRVINSCLLPSLELLLIIRRSLVAFLPWNLHVRYATRFSMPCVYLHYKVSQFSCMYIRK